MQMRVAAAPQHRAEAARVAQAQAGVVGEHQIHVIVGLRRSISGKYAQAAGHAQMNQHGAALHAQQQIFRAPFDLCDGVADQMLRQIHGHRPAQACIAHPHRGNFFTGHMRPDAAHGGFNFGQFRHGYIVSGSDKGVSAAACSERKKIHAAPKPVTSE